MMDMSEHNNLLNNNNPTIKLSQVIPEEYLYDPFNAEPTLVYLRAATVFLESDLVNANAAAGGVDGVTLDGTVTTDDDPTIESTNDDDDDDDTISNLHNVKLPSDKKRNLHAHPQKEEIHIPRNTPHRRQPRLHSPPIPNQSSTRTRSHPAPNLQSHTRPVTATT